MKENFLEALIITVVTGFFATLLSFWIDSKVKSKKQD